MKYVGAKEGSPFGSPLQEQKNCSSNNEEKGRPRLYVTNKQGLAPILHKLKLKNINPTGNIFKPAIFR